MLAPFLLAVLAAAPPPEAEPPGELRLVRSVSGTRGTAIGPRYEVEDPRTVFTVPDDRQLVVYFEWEGAPARYRLEGRWKDPSGRIVLTSPADYQATARKFGVYWTLGLPENAMPGLWALEAHHGGRLVGTHTFEIRGGLGAEPLPPAVLYEKGRHAVALVEQVAAAGEVKARGLVTAIDADLVLGPFQVVDGASSLRVALPDGKVRDVQDVGAWNRREGWAVLRLPGHGLTVLPSANGPAAVGSRVFVIGAQEDGGRTINEESVNGETALREGRRAPRLGGQALVGSAVLTGRGELLGVVVSGHVALGSIAMWSLDRPELRGGTTVLSRALLPSEPGGNFATLAQLAAAGAFMKPLSPDRRHVTSGVFAGSVQRGGSVPMPNEQRESYSRRQQTVSVFVQWSPQDKRESVSAFELYDPDNKRIVQSEPTKLRLRPRELFFSTWTFAVGALPPEVYRVDLMLDGAPVWRGWVRITD